MIETWNCWSCGKEIKGNPDAVARCPHCKISVDPPPPVSIPSPAPADALKNEAPPKAELYFDGQKVPPIPFEIPGEIGEGEAADPGIEPGPIPETPQTMVNEKPEPPKRKKKLGIF